jgi:dynein heavy chain
MANWVREADVFEIISKLDVFRNYRYWKSFRIWRSYIRKRRYKANKANLENSLFLLKPIFSKNLISVVKMCEAELSGLELLPLRPHANYTVADFNNAFGNGPNSLRRVLKQKVSDFVERVIF